MYRMSPRDIEIAGSAQTAELEKLASRRPLQKEALNLRAIGGMISAAGARTGNITGGLIGAGTGAAAGYGMDEENRTRGAILGALGGAALGVGGGQVATKAGRGEVKNFGLRQAHGMTGYLPGKGFGATHTMTPQQRRDALKEMNWHIPDAHDKDMGTAVKNLKKKITDERVTAAGKDDAGWLDKLPQQLQQSRVGQWWEGSKPRELLLKKRIIEEKSNRDLIDQGLTSLPGALRGYAVGKNTLPGGAGMTRAQQLKANFLAPGMALGIGLPAVSLVGSGVNLAQGGDPKDFGQELVDTAGFSAFSGLPILPAIAVGEGMSRGARFLMNRLSPEQQQQAANRPMTQGAQVRAGQGAGQVAVDSMGRVIR